ncbi:hypothetical protein [Caballeronia sordidicola]|uniref:Transmembrane protein n=1 Tax=Caballeronia sordidicola TaxID=196367 RepID=A0A242MW87_CABSO|nr:hypothetical protein [Caballeronia sordidicola]OTP75583.1 hypothetical protein PAMC26510_14165 [Caballeronia sordidicola]
MAPSDQNNHHHPGTFDELIFRRELNEVHLLLDFISGRPNAHIWDLDGKVPLPPSGARSATDVAPPTEEKPACCGKHDTTLDAFETIKWVCKLRYPPTPPSTDKAYDATLLFYVKDRLNSLAYPATGLSIAYTYIFVEEQRPIQGAHDPDREAQTRASVAREAYPGLIGSARRFRWIHKSNTVIGVCVTIFAAVLLWLVTYGVQITARFETDGRAATDITQKIYAEVDKENAASPADQRVIANRKTVPERCDASSIEDQTNTVRLLCNEWSYMQARYDMSIADAATFANSFPSRVLMWMFPTAFGRGEWTTGTRTGALRDEEPKAPQEAIQSITLVLSAYASYVLPILFALVGTIASLLRDIGNKITGNLLAPRDETLALMRVPLGLMAGVAVGLFFSPSSVATQVSAGAGVLTLTASGLAFLAGYAADGFFRMLDTLTSRVFNVSNHDRRGPSN